MGALEPTQPLFGVIGPKTGCASIASDAMSDGSTFFPWANAHSSRGKKVSPPPSSAALRPVKAGASSIVFVLPIAIEAAMVAGLETAKEN